MAPQTQTRAAAPATAAALPSPRPTPSLRHAGATDGVTSPPLTLTVADGGSREPARSRRAGPGPGGRAPPPRWGDGRRCAGGLRQNPKTQNDRGGISMLNQ
jgi:hypothetical protein